MSTHFSNLLFKGILTFLITFGIKMVKLCQGQVGNCRVWDCTCTTIHAARRQVCLPRTVTLLVDPIQLLAAVTEAHAMSGLELPGEVSFSRGITWVETMLVQEYRDRDSTSFQVHLKLPTNAARTHIVEVQNAYSHSCPSSTEYQTTSPIACSKLIVSIYTRRCSLPVMRDGSNCALIDTSVTWNVL